MIQARTPAALTVVAVRRFPACRTRRRTLTAGSIVVAVLAVAGPSWAGPIMGC